MSVIVSLACLAIITVAALWPRGQVSQTPIPFERRRTVAAELVGSEGGTWPHYGNTLAGTRFSPLTQINRENVSQLEPAWTYRTRVKQTGEPSGMEATPLMVNSTLYFPFTSARKPMS